MKFKKTIFYLVFLAFVLGCTRDDICSENTPTTPKLIITFKDATDPSMSKQVLGLTVETIGLNGIKVINNVNTDSIAIPLQTGMDTTVYRFTRTQSVAGINNLNNDLMTFTYAREDVYVNRACSFKTVYNNLKVVRDPEGDGAWINDFQIMKDTIENEQQTHITISH